MAARSDSSTATRPAAVDKTLRLGRHLSLTLEGDSLVVVDASLRENRRTCTGALSSGSSSANTTIALYSVLWAELSPDLRTLTIDYAQDASKSRLRAAKLTYAVPSAGEDHQCTPPTAIPAWVEALLVRAYGPAARAKRAYVLVNPHSGPGGADRKWEEQVRPIFEAARMPMTVVATTYSGEAIKLCQEMDIGAFDIVVPCSGDGLPHEVFNGLARRGDARRALSKMAVCHIPCGSGNAMSCNLYGTHKPSLAALAIVKGVPTPLDLVSITQGDTRIVSFLSQSLGIVAESDLATEHLRWMGGARFTYGFLVRLFGKKTYPCDLAVKVEIKHKDRVMEHYKREREYSSLEALEGLTKGGDAAPGPKSDGSMTTAGSEATASGADEGLPPLKYGTVKDSIPEGWELIPYDKMGNFYCGNMAYMAPDANFFSAACVNDGLMDLVCIDGDISPLKSIQLMLSVENGHFFENPLVSYRKISAYRIIPRDQEDGYISIDGERVPFEPFQAEVHQGLGKVLSKRGILEAPGPRNWDKVTNSERLHA